MKNYIILLGLALIVAACGSNLETKKKQVEEKRTELAELKKAIAALEMEISEEDSTYGVKKINSVLVTAKTIVPEHFHHMIEVRGSIQSRTNVTIGAEIPGKIESVRVKEGDFVTKGDLLFTQDSDIISNSIAELQTALELATTVANKQESLYKQNIGTEIQYLQTKNNKESLERKLATAKSQMAQARVRAPFTGTIDHVDAKAGEMAQPGMPMVRIVNPNDVHVKSDISERFIGKFKKGDQVEIYFPAQDKRVVSTVSSVSQVINAENRTFEMEVNLPSTGMNVRPNQVVVLGITDYATEQAIVVPTKVILTDNKGNYVYGLQKEDKQTVATKLYVEPGVSFDNITEIKSGLSMNQVIALKGYRELTEGVVVDVQEASATKATKVVTSK